LKIAFILGGGLLILILGVLAFDRYRLLTQIEADLGIVFVESPEIMETESYGWAEEGGDRALVQLHSADCAKVAVVLLVVETADELSEYHEMFRLEGLEPSTVRVRHTMNDHGDFKHFVLDQASCVLYWEAFFE
jgi:hypothetical protein